LIFLRCVFSNPAINLFVASTGRNKLFEFHCVEPGKLPEVSTEAARAKIVFAVLRMGEFDGVVDMEYRSF
jgi:hypothetical protein